MSADSEVDALRVDIRDVREDVRGVRATLESFIKTFNADVMSRLATLEQWKVSHAAEFTRAQGKLDDLQADVQQTQHLPELAATVAALQKQNDRQEGSISTLKLFGSLIAGALVCAEIVHTVIAIARGH
jgi:multidrug resistance efflux pump